MVVHRGSTDVIEPDELEDPEDVVDVIEDGDLTVDDTVVVEAEDAEETAILQVPAQGFEGAFEFEADEDDDALDTLDELEGDNFFELEIEEDVVGTVEPEEIELDDAASVVTNFDDDEMFIVIEMDDDIDGLAADQEYDITYELTDKHLLSPEDADETAPDGDAVGDDDEELIETATGEFETVEEDSEFVGLTEDDELELPLSEDAEVVLETNLAPGTEGELEVNSDESEERFRLTEDVTVDADGVAAATFDLTERGTVGDTFEALSRAEFDADEVDGEIVEDVEVDPFTPAVTVDAPDVDTGEEFDVDVTVENEGDETGAADLTVTVGGDEVLSEDDVELEGGATEDFTATVTAPEVDEDTDVDVVADYGEASDTVTMTVFAEEEPPEDDEPEDDEPEDDEPVDDEPVDDEPEDDAVPGFGVAVAALALLSAALLARFRN